MKHIKTLTGKSIKDTGHHGGCGECKHHASQHVRPHVQSETKYVRMTSNTKLQKWSATSF